MSTESVQGT